MNTSRQKIETVKMNTSRWFSLIVSIIVSLHEVLILTISNVSIVVSFTIILVIIMIIIITITIVLVIMMMIIIIVIVNNCNCARPRLKYY